MPLASGLKKMRRRVDGQWVMRPGTRRKMTAMSLRITKDQQRRLNAIHQSTGLPVTEIIRRAISVYMQKHPL
jgi:hypothetical protein